MPYIAPKDRPKFDKILNKLPPMKDGELNYSITVICHRFIRRHRLKYMTLARVIGGLICVVFELYRIIAAPYEDEKKRDNGFISELDRKTKRECEAIWKCKKCGHVFPDNEVHEVCGHETYYQCPECSADSRDWLTIRKSKQYSY